MSLATNFGKKLRKIRRQRDLSQEQLAEKIGMSVEFISNIERGVNTPSFKTLERLAEALQIPVKEMFDFNEKI